MKSLPQLLRGSLLPVTLAALSLLVSADGGAGLVRDDGRRPFAGPDDPPHYTPERLYDLQHVKLELRFDLVAGTVAGTATNTLSPLLPGVDHLVFHAAELDVRKVRLGGEDLPFTLDPTAQTLTVRLPHPAGPTDRLEVAIDYSAKPRSGLYFVGPDKGYPDKPRELFSQGETELNRYWFPSWDEPDDRATSEMLATVAKPYQAISNGRLVEVLDRPDGWRTYHWTMEQPHSTYLVSVAAGEFTRIADSWHGIPIEYYVPPALADRARRSFGDTPAMMDFFSSLTGRPYPYAKYAQVAVYDFMFGGMENITATTQTARTLHDERADLDTPSEELVSHELAHQWFGDLITCRTWVHSWLNEGMAEYFEALYRQHKGGQDEFERKLDNERQRYMAEDDDYRRPLVTDRFSDPDTMFDSHTYQKGSLVLNMIRYEMGEAGWQKGIRTYVEKNALGTVTTADFQSALEQASGVSLGALFEQFVYGAGYPELKVRWDYQTDSGMVHLEVRQTQRLDGQTGLFSFPVEIALAGEKGLAVHRVALQAKAIQDLYVASPARPKTVLFDPQGVLLKTIEFQKPAAEWIDQLAAADHFAAKLEALRALGDTGPADAAVAVPALGEALVKEPYYGSRSAAAAALGEIGTDEALAALKPGLTDKDSRARTAVFRACGRFSKHRELIPILSRALTTDPSYAVRGAAAEALGRFRDAKKEVVPLLLAALAQDSEREVVRTASLGSLARLEAAEAYEPAARLARYGAPQQSRAEAMRTLARLAALGKDEKRKEETRLTLEAYLRDPDFEVRDKAPDALSALGDPAALPALEKALASEIDNQQRHDLEGGIRQLLAKSSEAQKDKEVRSRLQQLDRNVELLQEQVKALTAAPQEKKGAPKPEPKP